MSTLSCVIVNMLGKTKKRALRSRSKANTKEVSFKTFGAKDHNETSKNASIFGIKTFHFRISTLSQCPNVHDVVTLFTNSQYCHRCSKFKHVVTFVTCGHTLYIWSHWSQVGTFDTCGEVHTRDTTINVTLRDLTLYHSVPPDDTIGDIYFVQFVNL